MHAVIEERPLPEAELVASLWQGFMAQVDWSARPDQIEGLALREVSVRCPTPTLPYHINQHLIVDVAFRSYHRTVLSRPKDGGRAYQHRADVLL